LVTANGQDQVIQTGLTLSDCELQEGLQRMKSVNNKPMPMELMQQLATRLNQYAEDDDMERKCPHLLTSPVASTASRSADLYFNA
jgi:hypothetical protein